MKCINKWVLSLIVLILLICSVLFVLVRHFGTDQVVKYESEKYSGSVDEVTFFSQDLAVTNQDTNLTSFETTNHVNSMFLLNSLSNEVLLSDKVHEKVYPASLTKLMTFYLAMKYGDLDQNITVSQNAVSVPIDSSKADLQFGDRIPLKDLLYALMLPSGNDSAVAIAEGISGDVDSFVQLMNDEANKIGATNTHFTNPHGYTDPDHYTTAYDLYLMLDQCMKYDLFKEIVQSSSYTTIVMDINGFSREMTWLQSNYFLNGRASLPDNIKKLGGKTGTTDASGACIALEVQDQDEQSYVAIIMGCDSRNLLYDTMTEMLISLP